MRKRDLIAGDCTASLRECGGHRSALGQAPWYCFRPRCLVASTRVSGGV